MADGEPEDEETVEVDEDVKTGDKKRVWQEWPSLCPILRMRRP